MILIEEFLSPIFDIFDGDSDIVLLLSDCLKNVAHICYCSIYNLEGPFNRLQVFHLRRDVDGSQPLGIILNAIVPNVNSAASSASAASSSSAAAAGAAPGEIREIVPGSPASIHGMTAKVRMRSIQLNCQVNFWAHSLLLEF